MAGILGADATTAQILAALLGVWLTFSPTILGYTGPAWTNDHIVGPIAATAGCVAAFVATRGIRWVNLPVGIWLVLAPWVLRYHGLAETANSSAVGVALTGLACLRGEVRDQLGGGWSVLWRAA